ncbi:MAG: hypothetical protein HYX73_08860 [Acidobacteria bacterium]|nr:hypothetical protein [Acidobacteriota bacterium]
MNISFSRLAVIGLQVILAFSLSGQACAQSSQTERLSREKVVEMVRKALGDNAQVTDFSIARSGFLLADFNGDGVQDAAVALKMSQHGFLTILAQGGKFTYLDTGLPPLPEIPHNASYCLGLMIFQNPDKFNEEQHLFYGCFSGWKLISKDNVVIPKELASAAGDALLLYTEVDAFLVLYNDGKSYRAYYEHEHQ